MGSSYITRLSSSGRTDGARRLEHLGRGDMAALLVVGEHVRQADERGVALGFGVVVALDCRGDRRAAGPSAGQHPADQRVVDTEVPALLVDTAPRGLRAAVDLRGIARIGEQQHQLADVV